MDIYLDTISSFPVIGKLGQGPADKGTEWVPQLWKDANSHLKEIIPYIKFEKGKAVGIWGIMSDVDEQFNRWGDQGKYLACYEAIYGVKPPRGWTKWTVPGYKYVVAECTFADYGKTFSAILNEYLPQNGYTLIGAVHEHYPQSDNPDLLELYFPIERFI